MQETKFCNILLGIKLDFMSHDIFINVNFEKCTSNFTMEKVILEIQDHVNKYMYVCQKIPLLFNLTFLKFLSLSNTFRLTFYHTHTHTHTHHRRKFASGFYSPGGGGGGGWYCSMN